MARSNPVDNVSLLAPGAYRQTVPDADMDMGGLSGGPMLLVGGITYPLVGVISEYHVSYELLRIATLEIVVVHET
jgi:hypothetical protein